MTELLRTAEVSDKTGIPVVTLRWWRHRREGPPSTKLDRKTVYAADQLAIWIESQRRASERGGVR